MAREHQPIQIGLPPESAWRVEHPSPLSLVAFVVGDEAPDPGDAFLAAGRAFGAEPRAIEPMPIEDTAVAWAFSFEVAQRGSRIVLWCERARDDHSPDGIAPDARWTVALQTLLEPSTSDDHARAAATGGVWPASVADFVALAATAVGAAGLARTRVLFDPELGLVYGPDDCARLFLGEGTGAGMPAGALADERHLYRIELRSRGAGTPMWITTVGLARVGKPELELIEVPERLAAAALELLDALAARFICDELPHAGVPFEAGNGLPCALVPAAEVAETVSPGVAGSPSDRTRLDGWPRAAVCSAGQRGSFRKIWTTPVDELERLARHDAGLYLSLRVVEVRERLARATWPDFMRAHAARRGRPGVAFLAKVARAQHEPSVGAETREHVWISVDEVASTGGRGSIAQAPCEGVTLPVLAFTLEEIGDWRVVGLRDGEDSIGPDRADRLADAPAPAPAPANPA